MPWGGGGGGGGGGDGGGGGGGSGGGGVGGGGGGGGGDSGGDGVGALTFSYAFYVLVFNYLSNLPVTSEFYLQVQQRFWPQAHLLCCVWYALGVHHVPHSPFAEHARTRNW